MNNKYFVQDLKSVNHTLVNGIMIPPYELTELENNDTPECGGHRVPRDGQRTVMLWNRVRVWKGFRYRRDWY